MGTSLLFRCGLRQIFLAIFFHLLSTCGSHHKYRLSVFGVLRRTCSDISTKPSLKFHGSQKAIKNWQFFNRRRLPIIVVSNAAVFHKSKTNFLCADAHATVTDRQTDRRTYTLVANVALNYAARSIKLTISEENRSWNEKNDRGKVSKRQMDATLRMKDILVVDSFR